MNPTDVDIAGRVLVGHTFMPYRRDGAAESGVGTDSLIPFQSIPALTISSPLSAHLC